MGSLPSAADMEVFKMMARRRHAVEGKQLPRPAYPDAGDPDLMSSIMDLIDYGQNYREQFPDTSTMTDDELGIDLQTIKRPEPYEDHSYLDSVAKFGMDPSKVNSSHRPTTAYGAFFPDDDQSVVMFPRTMSTQAPETHDPNSPEYDPEQIVRKQAQTYSHEFRHRGLEKMRNLLASTGFAPPPPKEQSWLADLILPSPEDDYKNATSLLDDLGRGNNEHSYFINPLDKSPKPPRKMQAIQRLADRLRQK